MRPSVILWHVGMFIEALLFSIPGRLIANLWRLFYEIRVPRFLRKPVYDWWARRYGVRLDEAERPIKEYASLQEVFTRRLQPGARSTEGHADMVSPIDGSIIMHGLLLSVPRTSGEEARGEEEGEEASGFLHRGQDFKVVERTPPLRDEHAWAMGANVPNNMVWVKGIPYRVQDLLGIAPPEPAPGNVLHFYSLFLPASEYHHFHSPVDWEMLYRVRIPGHVLPLLPEKARALPSMQWTNERVSMLGRWKYGFFAFTAIAATAMVAQIRLVHEPKLLTNQPYGLYESFRYLTGILPAHVKTRRTTRAYGLRREGMLPIGGEEGSTPPPGPSPQGPRPAHRLPAGTGDGLVRGRLRHRPRLRGPS